jgi:hypothetical protein
MRANLTLHPRSLAVAWIAGSLLAGPASSAPAAGQDDGSPEERVTG